MLDFGLAELLIIGMVLIFVIGPSDIPSLMQGLGRMVRRITYMKHALSMQMDQMLGTVDPQEVNSMMQKDMVVPEVSHTQEAESLEDESFDPRPVSQAQNVSDDDIEGGTYVSEDENANRDIPTDAGNDDVVVKNQQDLFGGAPR